MLENDRKGTRDSQYVKEKTFKENIVDYDCKAKIIKTYSKQNVAKTVYQNRNNTTIDNYQFLSIGRRLQ